MRSQLEKRVHNSNADSTTETRGHNSWKGEDISPLSISQTTTVIARREAAGSRAGRRAGGDLSHWSRGGGRPAGCKASEALGCWSRGAGPGGWPDLPEVIAGGRCPDRQERQGEVSGRDPWTGAGTRGKFTSSSLRRIKHNRTAQRSCLKH